jgi:hypothetical protein
MTWGLIIDVLHVLERHGYHKRDNQPTGQAASVIFDLARVHEGTREASCDTSPGHAQPGPPVPEAGQYTVTVSHADVGTMFAALDIAADYKRDRAATCSDWPDQSCPTCQSRLHDARAYDRLTAQILRTAEAQPAQRGQPEPGNHGLSPGQADPAADIEYGQ